MSISRSIPPAIYPIIPPELLPIEQQLLPNGALLLLGPQDDKSVFRLDILTEGGSWREQTPGLAIATAVQLKEGSSSYSSYDIAQLLDRTGASLLSTAHSHHQQIVLYGLPKYQKPLFDLLQDIIKAPLFPQSEYQLYLQQSKQNLLLQMEKSPYLAFREMKSMLYGTQHPYGRSICMRDYDQLQERMLLVNFHAAHYRSQGALIYISGDYDNQMVADIIHCFGSSSWVDDVSPTSLPVVDLHRFTPSEKIVVKRGAEQASIRLSAYGLPIDHSDFYPFLVLNTLFGGYFGSRLMANIREDKGYTYGISSNVQLMRYDQLHTLSAECDADYIPLVRKEIEYEMEVLRQELVCQEELDRVCHYSIGAISRSMDGSFARMEKYISYRMSARPYDYYLKQIEALHAITPTRIRELAQKHLHIENYFSVVVGDFSWQQ